MCSLGILVQGIQPTMSTTNCSKLPAHLLTHRVLTLCSVRDLARCSCASKSLQGLVQIAAQVILPTVLSKYYSGFTQHEDWLFSASPLVLLKQATEERLYALRDFATLFALNLRTLQWTLCKHCPGGRTFAGVELLNGYLYTFEWLSAASRSVVRYNLLTNEWSEAAKLPDELKMITSVVHKGSLYVLGYVNNSSEVCNIYVLRNAHKTSEVWEMLEVRLPPDTGPTCCVSYNGNVCIRFSSYVSDLAELLVFNPEAGTLVRAMVLPRALGAQYICVGGDQLYCYDSRVPSAPWDIRKFNINTGTWDVVAFNFQHVVGFRLALCGDKILFVSSEMQQHDAYCTRTGTWDSESCNAKGTPRGVRKLVFPPGISVYGVSAGSCWPTSPVT